MNLDNDTPARTPLTLDAQGGTGGPLQLVFTTTASVEADLPSIYRGMAGPPGPATGDDLPDFTLIFENQLI